jgi:high-affinity Fe2+/Pb2+ permease
LTRDEWEQSIKKFDKVKAAMYELDQIKNKCKNNDYPSQTKIFNKTWFQRRSFDVKIWLVLNPITIVILVAIFYAVLYGEAYEASFAVAGFVAFLWFIWFFIGIYFFIRYITRRA